MSSNYREEEEVKLLFLRWAPKLNCWEWLTSKAFVLTLAYLQCVVFSLGMITELIVYVESIMYYAQLGVSWYFYQEFMEFGTLAHAFISILLIVGIHKERKSYILAWLLVREVWILEITISVLFEQFRLLPGRIGAFLVLVLFEVVVLLVAMVVHTYYCTLTHTETEDDD